MAELRHGAPRLTPGGGTMRWMWPLLAATLCSPATPVHLEGDVTADGGDYVDLPFDVADGVAEIHVAHPAESPAVILDWGVWSPSGFRGWGGGLTDDAVIGIDQSSRGYLPGPIAAGTWTVAIGKAQLASGTGHYVVDITCSAQQSLPVLPKAAFQPIVMATGQRWYQGDFHVHSLQSGDSMAALQADIDLAHSRGLDFINLSDHNTVAQHALVAAQQPNWPVLVLRSQEITTYSGHGNGVGIHDYVDHRLGHAGRTIAGVIGDVIAQGGMFLVNHPATDIGQACIGCGWKHMSDVPWDQVSGLEILTAGYGLGEQAFTPTVIAMWDDLENQGHRLAAVSGSDDHTAGTGADTDDVTSSPIGSPTALVRAAELSEAAIIEAVRHQRTKVKLRGPTDPDLDFAVRTAAGARAEIGDDVDGVSRVEMPVQVSGGDGMFAQIWRDGAQIAQVPVTGAAFSTTFEDTPGAGAHRYRAELIDAGGRRVSVTSHIYVQTTAAASGGCGAAPGGSLLAVIPWLFARRRRRPR